MPRSLYPRGNSRRYPLNTRLGGPQTQSSTLWSTAKYLFPAVNRVMPSRYTDYVFSKNQIRELLRDTARHPVSNSKDNFCIIYRKTTHCLQSQQSLILSLYHLWYFLRLVYPIYILPYTEYDINCWQFYSLIILRVMPQARSPLHQNTHKSFKYATQIQECHIPWRHCLSGDLHKKHLFTK